MSIFINKELRDLIPPLSEEEYQQLEENIVAEGIRDPLVVWRQPDGHDMLIDGHNRWSISVHHAGIPFQVVHKDFVDMDEAKLWIINNQLGQRNLELVDKILLEDRKRGILAAQAEKKKLSSLKQNTTTEDKKSCPRTAQSREEKRQNSTDYKIAKAAGTSEDTVRKVRAIKDSGDTELIENIRKGEISINQAHRQVKEKESPPLFTKPNPKREAQERIKKATEAAQNGEPIDFRQLHEDKETVAYKTVLEIESAMNRLLKISMFNKVGVIDDIRRTDRSEFSKDNFKRQISDCIKFLVFIETRLEDW